MAGAVWTRATCNNSVPIVVAGGTRLQGMQPEVRDGAMEEENYNNKTNEIVTAGGGAGVWRMQSGVKDGAKVEEETRGGRTAEGGAATQEESKDGVMEEAAWGKRYVGQQEGAAKMTAEGGAATQGESKDGAMEEGKMVALREAVMESMRPKGEQGREKERKFNERWESFRDKQVRQLKEQIEAARLLAEECGVDQSVAVRALQETGSNGVAARLWLDKHRERVEANAKETRALEKKRVAERMGVEGIQLKKNGLRLKNWKPGARYEGWDGNTWLRKEEGKWLRRRLPVGIRVGAAPWIRVEDTEYGCLCEGQLARETRPTVSRAVVRQLGREGEVKGEIALDLRVGQSVKRFVARVSEENSPSLVLGDDVLRWLVLEGWGVSDELWKGGLSEADEPRERLDGIQCGVMPSELGFENGEAEAMEGLEWEDLIEEHQRLAVEGEEPGGLVSGENMAPLGNVLRENWRALMDEGVEVASGPPYTQPEDNPKEFQGLKQEFVPGRPHECFAAWEAMKPACDGEVLVWVRDMYEVKEHEEALGLTCRNGKEARNNLEALQTILIKRLREKSYEFAKDGVKKLVPVNLVEKLSATPPWRLVVNAREMNKAYKVWRTKYEGVHTVPLTVKKRDWLFFSGPVFRIRCDSAAEEEQAVVWGEGGVLKREHCTAAS